MYRYLKVRDSTKVYLKVWILNYWVFKGMETELQELNCGRLNLRRLTFYESLHDHIPSQSIRNEKIHWIRYPGCQNRTIFKDFRRWNLKFVFHNLRDCDFWALNLILSPFLCSYMIKHHLIRSGMKKYIIAFNIFLHYSIFVGKCIMFAKEKKLQKNSVFLEHSRDDDLL